ncbi:MAG: type I-E CRISPR-associated protein Cse1/CasA [Geminicoccaceae bacterium]
MTRNFNWLEQPLPFRRGNGSRVMATPLEITRDYADPDARLVKVETGHPFTDLGFEGLMRDLLQIALAPRDDDVWARRLFAPPSQAELTAALAPYRRALIIVDDTTPAMQVRPSQQRLDEVAKKAGKPRGSMGEDEGDEEDDVPTLPIAMLLPEQPTEAAQRNGLDFFAHGRSVDCVAPGLTLPLLYASMVLFPAAGGGYYGLPHGTDSIKYQILGHSVWETLWANVLKPDDPRLDGAPFPPPCDHRVFPWLDPSLKHMSLTRKDPEATRDIGIADRHPAGIAMPRRYLLDPPAAGRCALSGLSGPVFRSFRRWPNGLRYLSAGWFSVLCGERQNFVPDGNGWRLKPPAVKDGSEPGPSFIKAKGPLRYDDWLEAAIGYESPTPPSGSKSWQRAVAAPVVKAFLARRGTLDEASWRQSEAEPRHTSMLGREMPFRVRATGVILDGKIAVATAERSLPLFALNVIQAEELPVVVATIVEAIAGCAEQLEVRTRQAVKLGRTEGATRLDKDLRDALLQQMDATVAALPQRLVEGWSAQADPDAGAGVTLNLKDELISAARAQAITLFDTAFPLATLDAMTARIVLERRLLVRGLAAIGKRYGRASSAAEKKSAA